MKPCERVGRQSRANWSGGTELHRDHTRAAVQTLQSGWGPAYNEKAFHYFLDLERKRTENWNRPFLLMLIDLKRHPEVNQHIDSVAAGKLFSILSRCLRETDFTGWYREGRVAGAVLTQDGDSVEDESFEVVRRRIETELGKHLPSRLARDLQVRVYRVPPGAVPR